MWFVVALTIGAGLLAAAVLADRRERRREVGADEPAPARGVESIDRHVPAYVTQDEVDAMTHPAVGRPRDLPHRGEGFGFGLAHPDFATNPSGAALVDAVVLVVDGPVTSMREVLTQVSRATPERPLAIVAESFAPEVVTTLAANRRALDASVLAAEAERRDRTRLAELTGAAAVTPDDLKAGYVPQSALGHAHSWASTEKGTWVESD